MPRGKRSSPLLPSPISPPDRRAHTLHLSLSPACKLLPFAQVESRFALSPRPRRPPRHLTPIGRRGSAKARPSLGWSVRESTRKQTHALAITRMRYRVFLVNLWSPLRQRCHLIVHFSSPPPFLLFLSGPTWPLDKLKARPCRQEGSYRWGIGGCREGGAGMHCRGLPEGLQIDCKLQTCYAEWLEKSSLMTSPAWPGPVTRPSRILDPLLAPPRPLGRLSTTL